MTDLVYAPLGGYSKNLLLLPAGGGILSAYHGSLTHHRAMITYNATHQQMTDDQMSRDDDNEFVIFFE